MSAEYRITACSLPGFKGLVAEIYFGDRFIGLISEEDAPGVFQLELGARDGSRGLTLELEPFEAALLCARNELTRLRFGP